MATMHEMFLNEDFYRGPDNTVIDPVTDGAWRFFTGATNTTAFSIGAWDTPNYGHLLLTRNGYLNGIVSRSTYSNNFRLEVDFGSGYNRTAKCRVCFNTKNENVGDVYYLVVDGGYLRLCKYTSGAYSLLQSWGSLPAVTYSIWVEQRVSGTTVTFNVYMNGVLLGTHTNSTYTGGTGGKVVLYNEVAGTTYLSRVAMYSLDKYAEIFATIKEEAQGLVFANGGRANSFGCSSSITIDGALINTPGASNFTSPVKHNLYSGLNSFTRLVDDLINRGCLVGIIDNKFRYEGHITSINGPIYSGRLNKKVYEYSIAMVGQ